jgi:hypothetical protein
VDVINFSISGSRTSFLDPVEVAFLFAADAGVFVAASAGNSGPTASTVAHNSPWVTTVAAGTHDRSYQATATLGNGGSYTGAGLGAAVPSAPLILSADAGLAGADATAVRLCFASTTVALPCSTRPRSRARSLSATAASPRASTRASQCRRPAGSA